MIVKARLLLTGALLMFVQIPASQAQVTVDVAKITCEQLLMAALPFTSRDVVLWISGYYHGKHDNTIIEPDAIKKGCGQAQQLLLRTRCNDCHGRPQEHGIGQMMRLMLSR
jgi:hypothetical protein